MDGVIACFIGRVGADAEKRYTATGTAFLNVSLVVQDGTKGAEVYAEGRLKLNSWTAQDGTPRSGLNLTAWRLDPVGQIGRRGPRPEPLTQPRRPAGLTDPRLSG